jgi:hypothetical protein
MRDEEDLIDITFACEGKIGARKLVVFICSPYLKFFVQQQEVGFNPEFIETFFS